jgi:metal-responsive CopG/Arc/MetJ family transcriptional regulator
LGARVELGQMKIIQVVIDAKLSQACDRAAKKGKLNRSELVRLALREYLYRVQILEAEQCDQRGYEKLPQSKATDESPWEAEAVWPEA